MEGFDKNFQAFVRSFEESDHSAIVANLNRCFEENSRKTLRKVYQTDLLFVPRFPSVDLVGLKCPENYHLLFRVIQAAVSELYEAAQFLKGYSKRQILQGVANHLEKMNAELKYNAKWGEKYVNGYGEYLEVERQTIYSSNSGIHLHNLLKMFWESAPDTEKIRVQSNLETAEKFAQLFNKVSPLSELKDTMELHIYFGWPLVKKDSISLQLEGPKNRAWTIKHSEYIIPMKNRLSMTPLYKLAEHSQLQKYLKMNENPKPHPKEYWKHVPDSEDEETMKEFAFSFAVNIKADWVVEEELTSFKYTYLPSLEAPLEITLTDGRIISLETAFRVTSWMKCLARTYIQRTDQEFEEAVKHYSSRTPFSFDSYMIERAARKAKGDRKAIKEALKEHYNEEVFQQQQYIIWQSKNKVSDSNCLIGIDLEKVVQMIQWPSQLEAEVIREIIDLFLYDPNAELNITDTPIFMLNGKLYWLPNMFAYQSACEMLVEVLVGKGLVTLHGLQTQFYEKAITNLFKACRYAVIEDPEKKKYYDENGKELGDYDILAYKDGHVFHFELKLTLHRNSYKQRHDWKKNALLKGTKQLRRGRDYILENPEKVRELLGLSADAPFDHFHSYLVSNSFLFDGEEFHGYRKVSFPELTGLLANLDQYMYEEEDFLRFKVLEILAENPAMKPPANFKEWAERKMEIDMQEALPRIKRFIAYYSKPLWPNRSRDPELLAKYLDENKLFKHLHPLITVVNDMPYSVGEFKVLRPGLVARTVYVVSGENGEP